LVLLYEFITIHGHLNVIFSLILSSVFYSKSSVPRNKMNIPDKPGPRTG